MVAGFGGVRPYAGLTFMYKIKSKTIFDILLGGWFMKNVPVTFSVLKSIYEWSLILVIR